ncbi:hypothetical protein [Shewanella sp. SE1]|uniref:hypothetical protein n=1 Tax=Shewanella sp. SE1 TaxID=2705014 RepID=UPI00138F3E21|nr:hypothetical protein [Shewanella sp. SE1]NDO73071.1 hypothetical protein [Shewanella sp. SE1]
MFRLIHSEVHAILSDAVDTSVVKIYPVMYPINEGLPAITYTMEDGTPSQRSVNSNVQTSEHLFTVLVFGRDFKQSHDVATQIINAIDGKASTAHKILSIQVNSVTDGFNPENSSFVKSISVQFVARG